ncbi:MAG: CRISPR-associated helicase Cas3' [Vulcanisaeta sp.]|uniref:CRISPR-associated helicase Cas3' n=1 Tax=Vulcanisaeta sp. TaxID=2020871 RepID=UPI003D0DB852
MNIRPGINKALELIEGGHDHIILELPTGYGKSTGGLEIYRKLSELGIPEDRVIHVLPLRAVVEDLARRFYGILNDKVAYQAGIHNITIDKGKIIRKSPFFDADYNITTFDSFIHNTFKIPITEVFRELRHYYIPFARIYTSSVIFDEAHILIDPREKKMLTGFLASLELLRNAEDPVIIMSATLTQNVRSAISNVLPDAVFIRLGSKDENNNNNIIIRDVDFEEKIGNTRYSINFMNAKPIDVINKVIKLVNNDEKSVLIVINNIGFVTKLYEELKNRGIPVGLVHGELTRRDRSSVINNLDNDKYKVLVGTSAIEAGIDKSFNVLITTPDDAASLVQRVGRICRHGECNGELYFICEDDGNDNIKYSKKLCDYLMKKGSKINWRLPYSKDGNISYVEMLEEFKPYKEIEVSHDYLLSFKALERPYIPHDLINYLFNKQFNFNLARKELIEVYVRGREEFASASPDDVVLDSYTTDLDNAPIDCIESLGYVDEEPVLISDSSLVQYFRDPDRIANAYGKFVENYEATPIMIIKPNCYRGA